jgi:hypothetical protein
MIHPCATPGCGTLTFGEICLGCLQRQARALKLASEDECKNGCADEAVAADASS